MSYAPVLDNSDFEVNDLTCKSDEPPVEPEVLVDVWQGDDTFVRIPVTKVEQWLNKDGPSDLNRTAKVKFPGEWGGVDIQQYVNGFSGEEGQSYDMARVWFYDRTKDAYQITHFGYVGGVGPASEEGVFKFWVYDPADLLKGIPVSQSFTSPTIAQILDFAVSGTDEAGDPIGLGNRTVFEQIAPIKTYIAGIQEVAQQKQDTSNVENSSPVGAFGINFADAVDDLFDFLSGTEVTSGVIGGQRSFKRNRASMVDVMDWFADRVGGKWHFEPAPEGPVLWYDNKSQERGNDTLVRRTFADKKLVPERADGSIQTADEPIFDSFKTLNNMALRDMKPFNELRLYGESSNPSRYVAASDQGGRAVVPEFRNAASASALGEAFPYVRVTYEPLVTRADNHAMIKEVESDEQSLNAAREKAVKQFRQQLEEETEGSMELLGEPYIAPYDYVKNIPVCEQIFTNLDAVEMKYEVNSVKHTRSAGERFKTELGVSLALDPNKINVEAEYKPA